MAHITEAERRNIAQAATLAGELVVLLGRAEAKMAALRDLLSLVAGRESVEPRTHSSDGIE